ncbi:MAG: sensor histidine kinase [Lachnospiraceae bacterium]|nr:sensor histidine kinase [Lachnospiraceae bacterium]
MKFSDYINDHKKILLICFAGSLFFSVLLLFFGIGISELSLLLLCFSLILFITIWTDYLDKRRRIRSLLSTLDSLDQKYLLAEIADKPDTEFEKAYFHLLKTALKNMTDEIAESKRLNLEYRDYIEQWIHEIKVPITGIELVCENNKTDITRKIMVQTELIEQEVEKVLFYARLDSVEKDYLIKEISLKDCVLEVLARNKQFLIQNNVCVHTDSVTDTVYSDQKWVCFILNQILINSIKYHSKQPPVIQIVSHNAENYVVLSVTDNGIGIKPSEISRVFDKGFVGSNGRYAANATGIGLYLCERLCAKLGIGIDIESEIGHYTTVLLYFPRNDHLNI